MALDPGPGFRALIRPYTGQVTRIGPPDGHGFSTDLLAVVECENGPFFVKAMKNRPGGRRDQMVRVRGLAFPGQESDRLFHAAIRNLSYSA